MFIYSIVALALSSSLLRGRFLCRHATLFLSLVVLFDLKGQEFYREYFQWFSIRKEYDITLHRRPSTNKITSNKAKKQISQKFNPRVQGFPRKSQENGIGIIQQEAKCLSRQSESGALRERGKEGCSYLNTLMRVPAFYLCQEVKNLLLFSSWREKLLILDWTTES